MKKAMKLIVILMLMHFTSLAQDTNCVLIAGKATFHFNYYIGEIDSVVVDEKLQDKEFGILPNEVLVVDLYDNHSDVKSVKIKRRKIVLYYTDNTIESFWTRSGDVTFEFYGDSIERIIINRPVF